MIYGYPPKELGQFKCGLEEVCYLLYLPISRPGSSREALPYHYLEHFRPIIDAVREDEGSRFYQEHVYLTAKRMIVGPSITPNRPGWHADGFGTDDLNYVWYDSVPTIFSIGHFDISDDHVKSLEEFGEQAPKNKIVTYPAEMLLKLDPSVVHRVALAERECMRTFLKISISKAEYNLKGNSINPQLRGPAKMFDRALVRNDPHQAQRDYYAGKVPEDDHFK